MGATGTSGFVFRRSSAAAAVAALAIVMILGFSPGVASAAGPCGPTGVLSSSGSTDTCTFSYTGGDQTWTVPAGVTTASFDVQGAQGGNVETSPGVSYTTGGLGGEATADLSVSPGATATVVVGGQGGSASGCGGGGAGAGGFNGGAAGGMTGPSSCPGAGGGGASDVRIGGTALSDRVLIGGGGGGAADAVCILGGQANGGAGGGLTGEDGSIGNGGCGSAIDGTGGNQTGTTGSGQLGVGSEGSGALACGCGVGGVPGGGGGGGYYGGAGGGDDTSGGGGSGFGPAGTSFNTGVRPGDGLITVTFTVPTRAATSLIASPQVVIFPPPTAVGLGRVSATLSSGGVPVPGETIVFSLGATRLCTAVTSAVGRATCRLGLVQELRVLVANRYEATFGGDSDFLPSSASTPAIELGSGRAGIAASRTQHPTLGVRGTLLRGQILYATVASRRVNGTTRLILHERRRLHSGHYTLRLELSPDRRLSVIVPLR